MIGGYQSFAAAMQRELFQRQLPIEVHVIEMHERQNARVGASSIEVELDIDTFKFRLQHPRDQPAGPLVEVAQQQARMFQRRRQDHLATHEYMRLFAPLQVSRAEVNVEDMNDLAVCNLHIATDAAARFATRRRKIVDLHLLYGKTAQHYVTVGGATKLARLANAKLEPYGIRQVLRLILFVAPAGQAHNLLQGDYVGVKFAQHFRHAGRAYPPVDPSALVGVVCSHAKNWVILHNPLPEPTISRPAKS